MIYKLWYIECAKESQQNNRYYAKKRDKKAIKQKKLKFTNHAVNKVSKKQKLKHKEKKTKFQRRGVIGDRFSPTLLKLEAFENIKPSQQRMNHLFIQREKLPAH